MCGLCFSTLVSNKVERLAVGAWLGWGGNGTGSPPLGKDPLAWCLAGRALAGVVGCGSHDGGTFLRKPPSQPLLRKSSVLQLGPGESRSGANGAFSSPPELHRDYRQASGQVVPCLHSVSFHPQGGVRQRQSPALRPKNEHLSGNGRNCCLSSPSIKDSGG